MSMINVDFINPFLTAGTKILQDMCQISSNVGKPFIKDAVFQDNTLVIIIGITGAIKGQVIIAFPYDTACDIASKMMMSPITEMNEMANSAISELGNMILGNAATIFFAKGIEIDITPPSLCYGNMAFTTTYAKNICIPLQYEGNKTVEINIAIKQE